jgi:hypothetical protein
MKSYLFLFVIVAALGACSKSGGSTGSNSGSGNNSGNGSGNNNNGGTTTTALLPLAQNNVWNYKRKIYNTTTGDATDSSNFTLTVTGTATGNGTTYYSLRNSFDNSVLWMTNINSTTIGSIDSIGSLNYYTFFVSGTGDSTQEVSSWAVDVTENSNTCVGLNKLFGHYSDTTLINLDGIVYSSSIKNVVLTYDCSNNRILANVYFMKQGVGLVRYAQYVYDVNGVLHLQLAWVLESETLVS